MVEILDTARVEALCGEKHAHDNGDQRFQREFIRTEHSSMKKRYRRPLLSLETLIPHTDTHLSAQ